MTCIVGIVSGQKVFMGGDSCGSNGHNYSVYKREKIFKIQDRFLIGCTGTFRLIDVLQYSFTPPKVSEGYSRDRYMREEFVPALRTCLKAHGLLEVTSVYVEGYSGPFLVGFDGELFIVQSDLSVLPIPAYGGSVGSGGEAATAVLFHLKGSTLSPQKKLLAALEAAEGTIQGVRRPFEFGEIQKLKIGK